MDKRLFIVLWLMMMVWATWLTFFAPQPAKKPAAANKAEPAESSKPAKEDEAPAAATVEAPKPVEAVDGITLGKPVDKPDPNSEFFLSATLSNQGASVRELSLNHYFDEKRKGTFRLIQEEDGGAASYLLWVSVVEKDKEGKTRTDDRKLKLEQALQSKNWEVEKRDPTEVVFKTTTHDGRIEVRKKFLLKPGDVAARLVVEFTNTTEAPIDNVHYRLTGGNGLPVEGQWYTQYFRHAVFLVRPPGGFASLREEYPESILKRFNEAKLNGGGDGSEQAVFGVPSDKQPLQFLGVTNQYFASLLVQPKNVLEQNRIAEGHPIFVNEGKTPQLTNIGVEFRSESFPLKPGETVSHEYLLYNGPKDSRVLAKFDDLLLGYVIHYPGLFNFIPTGWISVPIVWILEFLHSIVRDYGIAILLLTILVRLCLYPLSYHQNRMMMRMQAIQPLMQQIKEECGDDRQELARRMNEVMAKHKVNPLGGCLPMFLQLPIFVGLWQALQNSFALRQADFLFGWTWIHDLSAPDQLFRWPFQIGLIEYYLGPYFNLLPILSTIQIILQMHYMSPPATSPEQQTTQRMMKVMMAFMGFLFYKVPSGLCIYIITSGLWGMAERKLMPKPKKPVIEGLPEPAAGVNGQIAVKRDESWKKPVEKKKAGRK